MLNDASERVSMSSDQDPLALFQLGDDNTIPVRESALNSQLQRFIHREFLFGGFAGVARVVHDDFVKFVRFFKRWRWNIETTSPNQYL